ncbi:MAG: helix-turn-helix domain-containing protein [Bradyrhizobiaceae bacterium]|nr:helix-turn-helix domain-containing protein [Bradyrhizobiaceae bacterium]
MREEAQLWDILARDLKREAGRLEEAPVSRVLRAAPPVSSPEADETKDEKLFVRIPEAAQMMGIGRSSLYKEIALSRIRVRKAGRISLIAVADIHAWFENLPESARRP